ncbi:hypothetical protein GOV12_01510 [Candidatus Pacearchaeota archaeon]|nr:hypothetical protein [Candidatus Pacearchaeota archaeon]
MKLQKHISRRAKSGEDYYKWEVILSKKAVEEAGFKEGDELVEDFKDGEIRLRKGRKDKK